MLRRTVLTTLSILVLGAAFATATDEPYEETIDRTFSVTATARLSLDNVNGDTSISVWDRDEIRVEAVKRASSPELLAELEVRIDASGDAVVVDTHYPNRSRSGSSSSVEYTVTVPRQARLDSIELVNGNLRIVGVEGLVDAECVNGSVHAEGLGGSVEIETVNGMLELSTTSLVAGDTISLESVNGSIEVSLPASAGVAIHAETVNGSIGNDLGLEVRKGRYVGSSMHGTVGSGAAELTAETVNGPISIRTW